MGYHSDVRCIIYGPSDVMQRFVTAAKLSDKYRRVFNSWSGVINIFTMSAGKPDAVTVLDLNYEDVIWEFSYENVNAWCNLMREAEEDDTWEGLSYEFLRIGEEHGDIEEEQSDDCDYLLRYNRPTSYLDIAMGLTTKGFPNETDNTSTGEE